MCSNEVARVCGLGTHRVSDQGVRISDVILPPPFCGNPQVRSGAAEEEEWSAKSVTPLERRLTVEHMNQGVCLCHFLA